MNIEILHELARLWEEKSKEIHADIEAYAKEDFRVSHGPDVLNQKMDQARREAYGQCAQDLKDVIRIYHEFKYPAQRGGTYTPPETTSFASQPR